MRVLLTDEEKKEREKAYNKAYKLKNKEKLKECRKAYCLKNKEKISAYDKEYVIKNKEKLKIKWKEHRIKNKERRKIYSKLWRLNNKKRQKENFQNWSLNNKEKILGYNMERHCRKFYATCKTSIKARREMIYLIASEISLETGIAHDVDHIIPISKGGINHEEFLMVTTQKYNCQKHDKLDHPLPEMQYLILDDLVQLYLKEV